MSLNLKTNQKELFLDEEYNTVPKEKARWLVVHTYSGEELIKEVWFDLKRKPEKEVK